MKGDIWLQMGTLRHPQTNSQKGQGKKARKRFRFKCILQSSYWRNWGRWGAEWELAVENGMKTTSIRKKKEERKRKGKKGGAVGKRGRGREREWQMSLVSLHLLNLPFEKTPRVWPEKREKQNENRHQQSTCCRISKKCKLMTGSKNLQRKQHPSLSIAINKSSTAYGNVNFNMKR